MPFIEPRISRLMKCWGIFGAFCFGMAFATGKAKAAEPEYKAVRAITCNTAAQAKEFVVQGQTKGLAALASINAQAGGLVCGVVVFGYVEHAVVDQLNVNDKLIQIERVVIISAQNQFTGFWQQPPPWGRVQYMPIRVPGFGI